MNLSWFDGLRREYYLPLKAAIIEYADQAMRARAYGFNDRALEHEGKLEVALNVLFYFETFMFLREGFDKLTETDHVSLTNACCDECGTISTSVTRLNAVLDWLEKNVSTNISVTPNNLDVTISSSALAVNSTSSGVQINVIDFANASYDVDTGSIAIVTAPTNGTADLVNNPGRLLRYIPDAGFTGIDTVTISYCYDLPYGAICTTRTITITVS
jgi:hypothetical protein